MRPIRTGAAAALALSILVLTASAMAADDPGRDQQWGLRKVKAPEAWSVSRGGGVTVAIVDSGADLDHEDLATKLVPGRNFIEDGRPPEDDNGHGTHVGGIVGAATGNGRGVAAVAPDVRIMPVRVLQDDNGRATGSTSDVSAGIRWAADQGAQVINLSLGENVVVRNLFGSQIEDAVEYAWSKGSICVIAAGNDFLFPSGYGNQNAIIVSATNQQDGKPSYSNGVGGAKWGMAAPGSDILSTWLNGYANASGTSMSAPHVAGAAALLRSLGASKQATVDALLSTADDIGASGRDSTFGSGRLNAERAVVKVSGKPAATPVPQQAGGSSPTDPPPATQAAAPRGEGDAPTKRTPRVAASDDAATEEGSADPGSVDAAGDAEALESPTPDVLAVDDDAEASGRTGVWVLLGLGGALLAMAGGVLFLRLRKDPL